MKQIVFALVLALPHVARAQHEDSPPAGLTRADWSDIRAVHANAQHSIECVDDVYQARNPGQAWSTEFDRRGFLTTPDVGDWRWGLELLSYGFESAEHAVTAPTNTRVAAGRVAYEWNNELEEWYLNDARGLEHGYIVHSRPARRDDDESRLSFTLLVRGGLRPDVTADARGVRFVNALGRAALTYTGLTAFDADGRELPARFEERDGRLLLSVDEEGARYPLLIDPIAQLAYLKASNAEAGDRFGTAVAVSGNTVVIGAVEEDSSATGANGNQGDNGVTDSGAVYVFVRSGSSWSQEAYLKASNTGSFDSFGGSVSISADTLVVGAANEESSATGVGGNQVDNSAVACGAAYVFVRSGTSWSQEAYLKASNAEAGDHFGCAVSASGDTIVVGAWSEDSTVAGVNGAQADNTSPNSGAAYVFTRSGTVWSQEAYLKASNTGGNDWFGESVAISGDIVVVGARQEDSNATDINGDESDDSAQSAGAAFVFARSGTTWSQEAYLKASNAEAGDHFGVSVSASASTIVVGATEEDSSASGVNGDELDNGAEDSGAAYVFTRDGTDWSQEAYLKASNPSNFDSFAWSLSLSGDAAVVGAVFEDGNATGVNGTSTGTNVDSGAAYVFTRSGTVWSQSAFLKASNTGSGDWFAQSVAVADGNIVIGALSEDSGATGINGDQASDSASLTGAAYAFAFGIGTTYCPLTPNSAGSGAQICAFGTTSVQANNLTFRAGRMASGEPGIFYYGPAQLQVPFGDGNRCVGGGPGTIVRIFPFAVADAAGYMSTALDNTAPVHGQVLPGATLNFQAWFRDPAGGGAGFNLSDAVSLLFAP